MTGFLIFAFLFLIGFTLVVCAIDANRGPTRQVPLFLTGDDENGEDR